MSTTEDHDGIDATEDRSPRLTVVTSTLLAIAIVVTALRCYVRIGLVKAFGPDDYLMVSALVRDMLDLP